MPTTDSDTLLHHGSCGLLLEESAAVAVVWQGELVEAVHGVVVFRSMLAAVVEHVDENSRKAAREKHAEHDDNRDKSLV